MISGAGCSYVRTLVGLFLPRWRPFSPRTTRLDDRTMVPSMPAACAARRTIVPAFGISLFQAGSATTISMVRPSGSGGRLPGGSIRIQLLARLRTFPLPSRLALSGIALIIVPDDTRHQGMSHNVALFEPYDSGAVDAFDCVQSIAQAGADAVWQVHLAEVAGYHHPGPLAHAGQEHLHLHGRGVLRLIQDRVAMCQGPAPH